MNRLKSSFFGYSRHCHYYHCYLNHNNHYHYPYHHYPCHCHYQYHYHSSFSRLRTFGLSFFYYYVIFWSTFGIFITGGLAKPTTMTSTSVDTNDELNNGNGHRIDHLKTENASIGNSELTPTRQRNVTDQNVNSNSSLNGHYNAYNDYNGNGNNEILLYDERLDELERGTEAIQEFQKLLNEQMLNSAAVVDPEMTNSQRRAANDPSSSINQRNRNSMASDEGIRSSASSSPSLVSGSGGTTAAESSAVDPNNDPSGHQYQSRINNNNVNLRHQAKSSRYKNNNRMHSTTTYQHHYQHQHHYRRHKIESIDQNADSLTAVIDSDNRRFYSAPAPNNFASSPYECPKVNGKVTQLLCPSRRRHGYHVCIDETALCNGYNECPNGEDENPVNCMFYKTTMRYFKTVVDQVVELSEHILEQSRRQQHRSPSSGGGGDEL